MNALIDQLAGLRLHGMAACAHDLLSARKSPSLTTAIKQLIDAETVERQVRSIEYQMRIARRYAMNANLIFKWLKDDRYAPAVDVVPEADGPVFLPVGIEASASVDPAVTSTPSGRIEIELSNGHRIIAGGGFDADMLARLLKGLSS